MPEPSGNALRAFGSGLARPSPTALWVAGLTVLVWLALAVVLGSPEQLLGAGPPGLWAEGPTDDDAFVAARALEVAAAPRRNRVVLLGTSADLFAIASPTELASRLAEIRDRRTDVRSLGGRGRVLFEQRALLEIAGPGLGDVLILGFGPLVLTPTPDDLRERIRDPRLPFEPEPARAELRLLGLEPGQRTGVGFVDHHRFFVLRLPALARNLVFGIPEQDRGDIARGRPPTFWQTVAEGQLRSMDAFGAHREAGLAATRRLLDRALELGVRRVVLLEMPASSRTRAELYGPAVRDTYLQAVSALSSEARVAHWDLADEAALTEDDFLDFVHLGTPEATARFTDALAARLAALLDDLENGS